MPTISAKLAYRPDIDGLRAIAVLGVVFFHAGLGFPGGYVGVDVFFAISGFLITSLILKELRQGTFSLLNFWERRARRIVPALVAVVVAILVAGWFCLMPADYEILGKQVLALFAFSSNIKFWLESGYFAADSETKPLLHTWSLSLEEQFYLLIPLLMAFLFRLRKSHWIVPILLLGAVVSLGLSIYGSYRAPAATFFLLPTRAWELATGSLFAFVQPIPNARVRTFVSWLGLAGIMLPFFVYVPGIRFPGLTALPPVAGTALLILSGFRLPVSGFQLPLPNRLLASRPFVWIGLLSYSLYLWHWPLFAYQKYLSEAHAPLALRLSLVAVSVMIAWLSLRFVETPFRSRAVIRTRSHVFVFSAGSMVVLMFASMLLWRTNGASNRLSPEAQRIAAGANDFPFHTELFPRDIPDNLVQLGAQGLRPKVLVWGDSHAMAILPAVDHVCKEAGIVARGATASAVVPVLDGPWGGNIYSIQIAEAFNLAVLDYIKRASSEGLSVVVLVARWEGYLKGRSDNARFAGALRRTVREVQSAGCKVIVLMDVPSFPFDPPRSLAMRALRGSSSSDLVINSEQHLADTALQRPILNELSREGVTVIDPAGVFTDLRGIVSPEDGIGSLYMDRNHLSSHGSMRLNATFRSLLTDPHG